MESNLSEVDVANGWRLVFDRELGVWCKVGLEIVLLMKERGKI